MASANLIVFRGSTRSPHTTKDFVREFDSVIRRYTARKIDAEELQMAKRVIAMEYLSELQSNSSLALDFATSEIIYGSWKALIDWYEQVMRVTAEDVERVAKQYLVKSRRTVATIEPKS